MSKQFEELSKNLASGMSRRKAFGRFAAGIGAAFGALALPRLARANEAREFQQIENLCGIYCRGSLRLTGSALEECVYECERLLRVN